MEVVDDDLLIMFKLVRSGYGSLSEVEMFDARTVLQALVYDKFINDYEAAFLEKVKDGCG
jgi:hypothetical protein